MADRSVCAELSSSFDAALVRVFRVRFGRRYAAWDRCVVDAGGIVGRHAGDGVVAFFLAETAGTEIRSREIEHPGRASRCATRSQTSRRDRRDPSIRAVTTVRAPLGCDPVDRANPHRRTKRSHRRLGDEVNEGRGADRSLRRPAAGHSPPNRSSNDSTGPTPTCGIDSSRMHLHPTREPRHRNRQGTPRRTRHRRLRHQQTRTLNAPTDLRCVGPDRAADQISRSLPASGSADGEE